MRKSLAHASDTRKWRLPYSLEEHEEHSVGKAPAGPVLFSPQGGMGARGCVGSILAVASGENRQGDSAFRPLQDGHGFFVSYPFQTLPVDGDDLITPFQTPIFGGCSLRKYCFNVNG